MKFEWSSEYSWPRNAPDRASISFAPTRKQSPWQCLLVGRSLVLRPFAGDEPNGFHRVMQRLAFGFKWERVT